VPRYAARRCLPRALFHVEREHSARAARSAVHHARRTALRGYARLRPTSSSTVAILLHPFVVEYCADGTNLAADTVRVHSRYVRVSI
jgi:hypothetical protein